MDAKRTRADGDHGDHVRFILWGGGGGCEEGSGTAILRQQARAFTAQAPDRHDRWERRTTARTSTRWPWSVWVAHAAGRGASLGAGPGHADLIALHNRQLDDQRYVMTPAKATEVELKRLLRTVERMSNTRLDDQRTDAPSVLRERRLSQMEDLVVRQSASSLDNQRVELTPEQLRRMSAAELVHHIDSMQRMRYEVRAHGWVTRQGRPARRPAANKHARGCVGRACVRAGGRCRISAHRRPTCFASKCSSPSPAWSSACRRSPWTTSASSCTHCTHCADRVRRVRRRPLTHAFARRVCLLCVPTPAPWHNICRSIRTSCAPRFRRRAAHRRSG